MRIRLVPLIISLLAASLAVVSAVAFGTALLPIIKAKLLQGGGTTMRSAWIAIIVGVATALFLAMPRKGQGRAP